MPIRPRLVPLALALALCAGCAASPVAGFVAQLGMATFDAHADGVQSSMRSGPYRIEADAAGTVWVLNQNAAKLTRLRDGGKTRETIAIPRNAVELAVEPGGAVWLADVAGDVVKLDPDGKVLGSWALGKGAQADLALDAAGRLWVAHFEGKSLTRLGPDGTIEQTIGLKESAVRMAIDGQGTVWVVTRSDQAPESLYAFGPDGTPRGAFAFPQQLYAVAGAPDGGAWLSDQAGTIRRLGPDGQVRFSREIGGTIWGLAPTAAGGLWLGTNGSGERVLMLAADGTPGLAVNGRCEDILLAPDGQVWFLNRMLGKVSRFSP